MKRTFVMILALFFIGIPYGYATDHGVAIQRVITNTRSELGQLASSSKANEISALMKTFDKQYSTWNESCGGEKFNPDTVSDACKAMADQMRETGIKLYGKLGEYLPDVAARYERGAHSAAGIIQSESLDISPADLYRQTRDGIPESSGMGAYTAGGDNGPDAPFSVQNDSISDPTDDLFSALQKLVPDTGKETPAIVRAGNAQISMMNKAKKAQYLAQQFEKAKFALESQREYGKIMFGMTTALTAMPSVLRLQYTGTKMSSTPNKKVIDYYRRKENRTPKQNDTTPKKGGFERRS